MICLGSLTDMLLNEYDQNLRKVEQDMSDFRSTETDLYVVKFKKTHLVVPGVGERGSDCSELE